MSYIIFTKLIAGFRFRSCCVNRRALPGEHKGVVEMLRRISPVAWQHIHFLGHYAFRDMQHMIDLDAILAGVDFS